MFIGLSQIGISADKYRYTSPRMGMQEEMQPQDDQTDGEDNEPKKPLKTIPSTLQGQGV